MLSRFLPFFNKKRRYRLKLDRAWPERKLEGGDEKIAHKKI